MNKLKLFLFKLINKIFNIKIYGIDYHLKKKIFDKNWKIPVIRNVGKSHLDLHEEYMFNHYKNIISFASTFIDVGANIGQTIVKVKSLVPNINYIAFEPSLVCTNYINELIKLNKLDNIDIYPIGLSNTTNIYDFFISVDHSQGNSIIEGIRRLPATRKVNIPVFQLDNLMNKLKITTNVIIKIDVEGAEYMVLDGMRNFINKYRPMIIMEFLRIPQEDTAYCDANSRLKRIENQEQSEAIFEALDYKIYCMTTRSTLEAIEFIGFNEDEFRTNYLIVHESTDVKKIII